MEKFIFWVLDCSFDYYAPFGVKTEVIHEEHGFDISYDDMGLPDVDSLVGYGAFEDVENCKNAVDFYVYLEENKKYAYENTDKNAADLLYERLEALQKKVVLKIESECAA